MLKVRNYETLKTVNQQSHFCYLYFIVYLFVCSYCFYLFVVIIFIAYILQFIYLFVVIVKFVCSYYFYYLYFIVYLFVCSYCKICYFHGKQFHSFLSFCLLMSKTLLLKNQQTTLCEKRPVTSLFWYVFSCIRIEYTVNLRIKSEYRKILTRKNSVFRDFSCSTRCFYNGQFFRKLFSCIKALTDKFLHLHERHLIKQKHLRSVINRS